MADDEDLAEATAAAIQDSDEVSSSRPPSMADWDIVREVVAEITDAISASTAAQLAPHAKKGKTPKPQLTKRPVSAQQRAVDARVYELDSAVEADIIARMT